MASWLEVLGSFQSSLAAPLRVRRVWGHERLSQLFHYEVELSSASWTLPFEHIVGDHLTVRMETRDGGYRFIHGYVASLTQLESDDANARYRAILKPDFWRLTLGTNCRVFPKTKALDVVQELLGEYGIALTEANVVVGRSNREPPRVYERLVQYRESDFNFVSRLLELEGIHYFFKHFEASHDLVLSDSIAGHENVRGPGGGRILPLLRNAPPSSRDEAVWGWSLTRSVLTDRYVTADFDLKKPKAQLLSSAMTSEIERNHVKLDPTTAIFEYPAPIVPQQGYSSTTFDDFARMRAEAIHGEYEVIAAETNCRAVAVGQVLAAEPRGVDIPPPQGDFIVTSTDVDMHGDSEATGATNDGPLFTCRLTVVNAQHPLRPKLVTPKPVVEGPQTATVVGKGPRAVPDQLGQVEVQFHWDRDRGKEKHSFCLVRVSQAWAGAGWGSLHLPHVGQEVIVSFLEGDPDRPIITGRVYNELNRPPVALPGHSDFSVLRDHTGQQIVFDGSEGRESIRLLSSNQNFGVTITNQSVDFIGKDRHEQVTQSTSLTRDQKVEVTKGQWFRYQGKGEVTINTGGKLAVNAGSDVSLVAGSKTSVFLGGSVSVVRGYAFSTGTNHEIKFTDGEYKRRSNGDTVLEAKQQLFLVAGEEKSCFVANAKEITLSYDQTESRVSSKLMNLGETQIKRHIALTVAATSAATGLACVALNAGTDDLDHAKKLENAAPNEERARRDAADAHKWGVVKHVMGDAVIAGGLLSHGLAYFDLKNLKIPPPQRHKKPSAKVSLKKESLTLSALAGDKTVVSLTKNVLIKPKEGGVSIEAAKAVKVQAKVMDVNGNLKVLK